MNRWMLAAAAGLVVAVGGYVAWTSRTTPSDTAALAGLQMIVHKSPTCGCCGDWIEIMRSHGVDVASVDTDDIVAVKVEHSVPQTEYSCHTAEIGGYIVEGHIPAEAIAQLLTERPDIHGIAMGGMPQGSPGMSGVKTGPFEVMAYSDGGVRLFGRY